MTTTVSPVIAQQPAQDGKPGITYRQAGERAVLVEYGEMVFDLALNFLVLAANDALGQQPPDGLVETAPGFRSMLVSYDPFALSSSELVDHLRAVHDALDPERGITIPSRLVHLPIAFDDSQTKAAVERYVHSIRSDAPNAEGGTNIDYVVRYNGLRDRDELYETALATEHWTAFIGFFPGLPFMFPLDPRDAIFVPKYNPTRTWTPEGAVGIGGPCYAIYPVESAGGYQLIGRSAADLRRPRSKRGLPREPAAAPRRRPRQVPPGHRGGAPAAVRGRPRRHLPLPDRRRDLRRRRVPRVGGRRRGRGRRAATTAGGGRRGDARSMRSLAFSSLSWGNHVSPTSPFLLRGRSFWGYLPVPPGPLPAHEPETGS